MRVRRHKRMQKKFYAANDSDTMLKGRLIEIEIDFELIFSYLNEPY
jgi:hypothetical protein